MSYALLKSDVLFYQRFLKANGFYTRRLDGVWGANTDAADKAFLDHSKQIADQYGAFDARSEANIVTLVPKAQVLARKFLAFLRSAGHDVRIISGTRTYAEQNALYAKGRNGNAEKKVTNAKGGQSNHNFGLAWDIGLFESGKYITADAKYKNLANTVMTDMPDLEWGGSWKTFPDYPHYQHKATSDSITEIRGAFENGAVYV